MGLLPKSFASFTSEYQPTGAFSLEFKKRGTDPTAEIALGEYFFLLGPLQYTHQYRFNVSVRNTYDGAVITDYGNGLSDIQLQGELNIFYSGVPSKPSSFNGLGDAQNSLAGGNFADAAKSGFSNFMGKFGEDVTAQSGVLGGRRSGVKDFFDLMFLMWDSRTKEGFKARQPQEKTLAGDGAGAIATQATIQSLDPFDYENIKVVYHDYDRDSHWEVVIKPDGLSVSQSAQDPFTYMWTLNFVGVKDMVKERKALFVSPLPSASALVFNTQGILETAFDVVTGPLVFASNVVSSITQLKNIMGSVLTGVQSFVDSSKDSIRNIRSFNKRMKDAVDTVKGQIENWFIPNTPNKFLQYILPAINNLKLAIDPNYTSYYDIYSVWADLEVAATLSTNDILSKDTALYVVPAGKSWERLAVDLLGSSVEAEQLKILNGVSVAGKELSAFVGKKIKVPNKGGTQGASAVKAGAVIPHKEEPSQADLEYEIYGEDISLTADGDLFASFDGDMATVIGLDTLIEHQLDRLTNLQGTVPMHPAWGAAPVPGELSPEFTELVAPVKVMENVSQDPAVQSARMTYVAVDGDRFDMGVEVTPVGGFEVFTLTLPHTRIRSR